MLKPMIGGGIVNRKFMTQWKTDNAGTSTSTQISIPVVSGGTYNCTVYWGDGSSNTITTFGDAAWTHTYSIAGTYSVSISGSFIGFSFNGGGDRLKLLNISRWGGIGLGPTGNKFDGCSNLTITAQDLLDLTGAPLATMFRTNTALTRIPSVTKWNWRVVAGSMTNTFATCANLNQNMIGMDVSNKTSFNSTFASSIRMQQNFGPWVVTSLTTAPSMFNGVTLSNANYNSLLIGWAAQTVQPNVTFSGGNSHYDGAGVAARAVLTGAPNNWTISDGGTP